MKPDSALMVTNDGATDSGAETDTTHDAWMTLPPDADPDDVAHAPDHPPSPGEAPERTKPARSPRASRRTAAERSEHADDNPSSEAPRKTTARRAPRAPRPPASEFRIAEQPAFVLH